MSRKLGVRVQLIFFCLCMSVCAQNMLARLCEGICKPPGNRKPKHTRIKCTCRFLFSEGPKRAHRLKSCFQAQAGDPETLPAGCTSSCSLSAWPLHSFLDRLTDCSSQPCKWLVWPSSLYRNVQKIPAGLTASPSLSICTAGCTTCCTAGCTDRRAAS